MATVTIYLRNDLGRALSYAELDANFKNIKDTIENLGIDDLTDVVILSPQNGDVLVYDTSINQWVNTQNLQGSYVLNQLAVTGMTQNNSPSYFVSYDDTTGEFGFSPMPLAGTSGSSGVSATGANYYGSFSDSTTQVVSAANTPTILTYDTTEISNHISVVSNSRITFDYTGVYEIGYSLQVEKTQGGTSSDVHIFVRKNGTDIVRTD